MYITDKQLRGHLAMWVCRQHPYRSVEGVDEVGALIDAKAKEENWFGTDEVRMKDFSGWQEVESWLRGVIWDHPQMTVWNTPKSGRDGGSIMFVSRFNHPSPEEDFIDLGALLRNVALEAWRESERNDGRNASDGGMSEPVSAGVGSGHLPRDHHPCPQSRPPGRMD